MRLYCGSGGPAIWRAGETDHEILTVPNACAGVVSLPSNAGKKDFNGAILQGLGRAAQEHCLRAADIFRGNAADDERERCPVLAACIRKVEVTPATFRDRHTEIEPDTLALMTTAFAERRVATSTVNDHFRVLDGVRERDGRTHDHKQNQSLNPALAVQLVVCPEKNQIRGWCNVVSRERT